MNGTHALTPAMPGPGMAALAVVAETDGRGAARSVRLETGALSPVAGHGTGVPFLRPGDRVVVAPVTGGCVVTDRLRAEGESPAARVEHHPDGGISLWAEGAIRLHTRGACIELHPDGRLVLDGREVAVVSTRRLWLKGRPVRIN